MKYLMILLTLGCEPLGACEHYENVKHRLSWDITQCGANSCVEWHLQEDKRARAACEEERNAK